MREISVEKITEAIREMCMETNYVLSADMQDALQKAQDMEESRLGREILSMLEENLSIAKEEQIPICQDTGMAVVFLEIGQDVHLVGGSLTEAVNRGVALGYEDGYLRKSVVKDPLLRENTGNNAPAVIHTEIVDGDNVLITLAPKGCGSENMSKVYMLKPSDGESGVLEKIVTAVKEAGPNACPPMVVGVGIGGTFEKCALLAKKALLREIGTSHPDPHIASLEKDAKEACNALGIGPAGLGGSSTVLAVQIETYATHIAGLPVAVNICCHVNRHSTRKL